MLSSERYQKNFFKEFWESNLVKALQNISQDTSYFPNAPSQLQRERLVEMELMVSMLQFVEYPSDKIFFQLSELVRSGEFLSND